MALAVVPVVNCSMLESLETSVMVGVRRYAVSFGTGVAGVGVPIKGVGGAVEAVSVSGVLCLDDGLLALAAAVFFDVGGIALLGQAGTSLRAALRGIQIVFPNLFHICNCRVALLQYTRRCPTPRPTP